LATSPYSSFQHQLLACATVAAFGTMPAFAADFFGAKNAGTILWRDAHGMERWWYRRVHCLLPALTTGPHSTF